MAGGKTSGSFIPGDPRAGRPKNVPNKTTKEARQILENILMGQLDNIEDAFNKLQKDPAKYIDACAKMFGFILPKRTDITSGDEVIKISFKRD